MKLRYKENLILDLARFLATSYYGVTISEIMEKYEVSRRTAERMLNKIKENFDCDVVQITSDRQKKWRVKSEILPELIKFSLDDTLTLSVIEKDYKSRGDNNTSEFIKTLIDKIKVAQYHNILKLDNDIESIMEKEGYAIRQYPKFDVNNELLAKLRKSIIASLKLKIKYNNDIGLKRIICPLGILHSTKPYLIGLEINKDNEKHEKIQNIIKTYSILKIKEVKILDEYFEIPKNFNLQEFANNSFGIYQGEIMEVVLKFNKKIKDDVINYHFHPTQKMEIKKDFVIVSFRASGDEAICWELFKWGDNVQIIKPKKLKEIYKNKLLSVLKKIK